MILVNELVIHRGHQLHPFKVTRHDSTINVVRNLPWVRLRLPVNNEHVNNRVQRHPRRDRVRGALINFTIVQRRSHPIGDRRGIIIRGHHIVRRLIMTALRGEQVRHGRERRSTTNRTQNRNRHVLLHGAHVGRANEVNIHGNNRTNTLLRNNNRHRSTIILHNRLTRRVTGTKERQFLHHQRLTNLLVRKTRAIVNIKVLLHGKGTLSLCHLRVGRR